MIESALRRELGNRADIFFIQIGSHDGVTGDPLHKLVMENPGWRGIFVEPLRFLFERLLVNYGNDPRFQFENIAIADESGPKDFYFIEASVESVSADFPEWHDQLGSFDKNHIIKHLGSGVERFISSTKVDCLRFPELIRRHHVQKIDLLHVDTEGYDFRILSQVDLNTYHPLVVIMEHVHLSSQEKLAASILLAKQGYHVTATAMDYFAKKNEDLGQSELEQAAREAAEA